MLLLNSTLLRQRLWQGKENVFILGLVAFLIMSFWSLYSMPTGVNGEMLNCPLMNGSASLCQMNVFEHISQWQKLFTVIQGENLFLLFLASLVFIHVASFVITKRARDKQKLQRLRNYFYWYKPEIKLFDKLLAAFSQGIINPKIYRAIS